MAPAPGRRPNLPYRVPPRRCRQSTRSPVTTPACRSLGQRHQLTAGLKSSPTICAASRALPTDKSDANWIGVDNIWPTGSRNFLYSLTGLTNSTQYDVQIQAENAAGRGGWSTARSGTPGNKPDAPERVTVTAGDASLAVTWAAASGGGTANRYDLRHKKSTDPDAPASWTTASSVWTTGSGTLEYELTRLENGISYDVQMRGGNSSGAGPWSTSTSATPQGVPGAPEIDNVVPGPRQLTVSWKPPTTMAGRRSPRTNCTTRKR